MPTLFETTDVDAAYEFLCGLYARLRLTLPDGPRHVRLAGQRLGPVRLQHDHLQMTFAIECGPLETLAVGRVRGGAVTFGTGSRQRTHGRAGELFLVAQPEMPFQATAVDPDMELALLDPTLLTEVVDVAPGRVVRPVRFTGYRPVSPAAALWWSHTYDYVRDHLATSSVADAPLVTGAAGRLLAAGALAAFPHDGLDEPTIEDRRDAHPAVLRRALAFIDDNAHRDVSPADIATAARVTIRTLQLAFRRHLDTTPNAYLRRVRLELAHRELQAADPDTTSIAAVAARWGFGSHSRFSSRYRAAFGRSPSTTLHHR